MQACHLKTSLPNNASCCELHTQAHKRTVNCMKRKTEHKAVPQSIISSWKINAIGLLKANKHVSVEARSSAIRPCICSHFRASFNNKLQQHKQPCMSSLKEWSIPSLPIRVTVVVLDHTNPVYEPRA